MVAALAAVFLARFAQLNARMPGARATPVAQAAQEAPAGAAAGAQTDAPARDALGPDPLRLVSASGGRVEVRDAGGVAASFASLEPEDGFGESSAMLAGDLLAVGAPTSGLDAPLASRVYILPTEPRGQVGGPGAGDARAHAGEPTLAQRAAPIVLSIGERGARFGTGVAALENPFGAPLVLVTAPGAGEGPARGRAYLFDPLAEADEDGALAPIAELEGLPGDRFGVAAERVDDLNGDGLADASVLSLFVDDAFNTRLRAQTFTGAGELIERQTDVASPIVRLAGDLNGDGVVDAADLGRLLSNFGRALGPSGVAIPGDLNRDGVVDGADLALLLGGFGEEAMGTPLAEVLGPCQVECFTDQGLVILCDACAVSDCCNGSGGGDGDDGGPGSRDGTGSTGGDGGGGGGGGSPDDDEHPNPDPPRAPDGGDGGNDECELLLNGPRFGPTSILAKGRPYTFSTSCEDPSWSVSGGDAVPQTDDEAYVTVTFTETGWRTVSPGCGCSAQYLIADIPMELEATFVEAPAPPDGGDPPPEFAVLLTNNDDDDADGIVDKSDGDGVGDEAGVIVEDDLVELTLGKLEGATSGNFVMDQWRLSASGRVRVWYNPGEGDLHAFAPEETNPIVSRVFNGVTYRLMPTAWIEAPPRTQTYLVEGVNASASLADARLQYTFQGVATWQPSDEEEPVEYSLALVNNLFATVFAVDLDIDSDNNGVIDDGDEGEEELPPGKVFFVNSDDDDGDGTPDKDQSGAVAGEDDLVPIELEPGPSLSSPPVNSWWALDYPAHVRVWFDADRTGLVDSGATQFWPPPDTLYVEGLAPSQSAGDVEITLREVVYGAGAFTDEVVATVAGVDLDIDSDNDDGFAMPQRTAEEDEAEDEPGGMKVLLVGRDDQDGDDIPDYADGFGAFGEDSQTAAGAFIPLVVEIDGLSALPGATVSFEYDAADPSQTTRSWVDIPDIQSGFYEYDRGPGLLRIWRKDAGAVRTHDDFVASGAALDAAAFGEAQTFFVEAVNGSATGVPITVTLTSAGGASTTDTVRALPLDSLNGLGEPEIEGFTIHIGSTGGTSGNDIVIGTSDDDIISTGDGDDIIVAGAGDDVIDAGAGDDVVFAWDGNNEIDMGGELVSAASAPRAASPEDRIITETDGPLTTEQVLLVYRLQYGENDPWLDIFFNKLNGVVASVKGDGVPFSKFDWDHNVVFNDAGERHWQYVVQLEFSLQSPVVAAARMREMLLEIAKEPGPSNVFQGEMIGDAFQKALLQEDFDDEITTFRELRDASLQNAAAAAETLTAAYIESLGIVSEGADLVITLGEFINGDIGAAEAGVSVLPFVGGAIIASGKRAILRKETGEKILERGADVPPGLDKRVLQAPESGPQGVGLIPRSDFARATTFEVHGQADGRMSLLAGSPQGTSGGKHDEIVDVLARGRADDGAADYVVINRSLKTATGRTDLGAVSGWRPDIIVVRRDGRVDLYEVQSGTDDLIDLSNKLRAMRAALPSPLNEGGLFLIDITGKRVPLIQPSE